MYSILVPAFILMGFGKKDLLENIFGICNDSVLTLLYLEFIIVIVVVLYILIFRYAFPETKWIT